MLCFSAVSQNEIILKSFILNAETQHRGSYEFALSFSRQRFADYLSAERSKPSLGLGWMRREAAGVS